MRWESFDSSAALSLRAATLLLDTTRKTPSAVLGLPTGRTPIGMYERIVRECGQDYHCFTEVVTFNLDEYVGVEPEHPASYASYMRTHLFDHVDIQLSNVHIPHGTATDLDLECRNYEEAIREARGIDLMFLGLGRNGHIGFNEPGTPFNARTRVVELTESTRRANAAWFEDGNVPSHAITMGIETILDSRRIILLAAGDGKSEAIERLRDGEISENFPASALRLHPDVLVLCAANS
ncbi:MAG TPA: glucosamine-6-phosphate deaminase [Thermoanaerobaculia bacterium]